MERIYYWWDQGPSLLCHDETSQGTQTPLWDKMPHCLLLMCLYGIKCSFREYPAFIESVFRSGPGSQQGVDQSVSQSKISHDYHELKSQSGLFPPGEIYVVLTRRTED